MFDPAVLKMPSTLYQVLGILPSASQEEIRAAFKRQALAVHPDKGGDKHRFHAVLDAFETLSDLSMRALYDQRLAGVSHKAPNKKNQVPNLPTSIAESRKKHISEVGCRKLNSDADHENSSTKPRAQTAYFISKLVALLRQLPQSTRHSLLGHRFSETERLALESWMREQGRSTSTRRESATKLHSEDPCAHENIVDPRVETKNYHKAMLELCDYSSLSSSETESCDDAVADSKKASCDASSIRQSNPFIAKRRTKGISIKGNCAGGVIYAASVSFGMVRLTARTSTNLAIVLDHLVVLTAIRQRTLSKAHECLRSIHTCFYEAAQKTLEEHGILAESIGLGISFRLQKRYWVGRTELCTPVLHCIAKAEHFMQQLMPFQGSSGFQDSRRLLRVSPDDMLKEWEAFRVVYLDVCEAGGWSRQATAAHMDSKMLENGGHRERAVERWNRRCMVCEDHISKRAEIHESRILNCILRLLIRWRRQRKVEELQKRRAIAAREKEADRSRKRFRDLTFAEISEGVRAKGERRLS